MLLAVGCSNDLPVASALERTRVLGARVEVAADPGRAEVTPGEAASVAWLIAGPSAPATLDWAFALCTDSARRRLRGRAPADRRRQRRAGDGALHDAGRGGAGDRPAAAHARRRVRRRDGRRRSERAAADLHRPRRERHARALHHPGRARRRDAQPPPRARQRRHRARGRGVGSGDRDGGDGRRLRRERPGCRSSPRRRRARRRSSRRSASSATATTARRSRRRARRRPSWRSCRSRTSRRPASSNPRTRQFSRPTRAPTPT